ncbi:ABC transporter permease [Blastococcus sp. URHD0036]|uniref:ABC transporter permease n=1 Tax=Blastococcus sp. URHD0036 TaxID=1380356 RepID=UPI00049677C6|nr:ABC transporter permease [Blastococcus sp. URHD0036]
MTETPTTEVVTPAPESTLAADGTTTTRRSRSRVMRRLRRNRGAMIAAGFIALLILVAALGGLLPLPDPNKQDLVNRLSGPSGDHWLGTDSFGRDTLSRLVAATRVTLLAATEGLLVAVVLGVPLGLLAGYVGGATDAILSRIADGLLSLPGLVLALAIVGVAGPGLTNAMVAIGIVFAPRFYRVGRSAAQSVSHETYIEAVRADGVPTSRILLRHILPNSSGPLLVQASFAVGFIITAEASLSFLGLGVQVPDASWGSMVREGFAHVHESTFAIIPPAVMITLTVFAFSQLGDGLRDALGRDSRGS